jgi:aspartate ammonia-lyase
MRHKNPEFRIERDSLGEVSIPAHCYWGARTARAQEHLFLCGVTGHGRLIEAAATVKKAMAQINQELGLIDQSISHAIVQACDEVLAGQWHDQFVCEPFQSEAGHAFEQNLNEVLANRAEQLMGGKLGEYKLVNPDHHLNIGQTAKDVFSVAMRLAVLSSLNSFESPVLDLERLLRRKAVELAKAKGLLHSRANSCGSFSGEQAFNSFGSAIEKSLRRIKGVSRCLMELYLSNSSNGAAGSAVPEYCSRLAERLSKLTGLTLHIGDESGCSLESLSDFLQASAALKELAIALGKIASDLRQLTPYAIVAYGGGQSIQASSDSGLRHIGIADTLNGVAFQVIGNDLAVALASQTEQAQVAAVAPMVVNNLLQSIDLLRLAISSFNHSLTLGYLNGFTDATWSSAPGGGHFFALLSEHLGLDKSRQLYEEFSGSAQEISDALGERNMVSPEVLEKISRHSRPEENERRLHEPAKGDKGAQSPESE